MEEVLHCVDYRELNKKTVKDAYPLPLPDEVQDNLGESTVEVQGKLGESTVFSTLDLHSDYWQLFIADEEIKKMAFCPGSGMVLYQFQRLSCKVPQVRLMDQVLRVLPTYIDDMYIGAPFRPNYSQDSLG
jgi:hypothetical protein